jgi:hypothetical protein
MRCDRCLGPKAIIGKLCGPCYQGNVAYARRMAQRAATKDEFGAIRTGQLKGVVKTKLPVGAITIRTDNGIQSRYVKVRMNGCVSGRWIQYGKWWWTKNRGPIPPGQLVLHKDGDPMNDHPGNFIVGTPGMKLVLAHQRDEAWSKEQHKRCAAGTAEFNRRTARINREKNFLQSYWYPVVDEMGVILNIPFRKRKHVFARFGVDVSKYPKSGQGKKPGSQVQLALRSCAVRPVKSAELSLPRYRSYCLADPVNQTFKGPMGHSIPQLIAQLERMKVWPYAVKCAKKDLKDRK